MLKPMFLRRIVMCFVDFDDAYLFRWNLDYIVYIDEIILLLMTIEKKKIFSNFLLHLFGCVKYEQFFQQLDINLNINCDFFLFLLPLELKWNNSVLNELRFGCKKKDKWHLLGRSTLVLFFIIPTKRLSNELDWRIPRLIQ